ncbi:MAG: hypothetical protein Q9198_002381, partial [Flavoplaca austrocitrina]
TQLSRDFHVEVPDEGHREREDIEIAYCIEYAREIRRDIFLQAMTWYGRVVHFLQRIAKENRSEEEGDVKHPDTKEAESTAVFHSLAWKEDPFEEHQEARLHYRDQGYVKNLGDE